MSRKILEKDQELEEMKASYWREMKHMADELKEHKERADMLERSMEEIQQQSVLNKSKHDQEKQLKEDLFKSHMKLDTELKELQKTIDGDLQRSGMSTGFGTLSGSTLLDTDTVSLGGDEPFNFQTWKSNYEKQMANLNNIIAEEAKRRANDPLAVSDRGDLLKDFQELKNRFEFELEVYKRKLKIETQSRAQFERALLRLQEQVELLKRQEKSKSHLENDANAIHLLDKLSGNSFYNNSMLLFINM
jgi:hypothetical protein